MQTMWTRKTFWHNYLNVLAYLYAVFRLIETWLYIYIARLDQNKFLYNLAPWL